MTFDDPMTFDQLLSDFEEHIGRYFNADMIAIAMNVAESQRNYFERNPRNLYADGCQHDGPAIHQLNWLLLNWRVVRRINEMFEHELYNETTRRHFLAQMQVCLLVYENRRIMMEFL